MTLKYVFVILLNLSCSFTIHASAASLDYEQKTRSPSSAKRSNFEADIEKIYRKEGLKGVYKWQQGILQSFFKVIREHHGFIPKNIYQLVPKLEYLYPLYELGRLHIGHLDPYLKQCLFFIFNQKRSTLATQGCQILYMPDYVPNNPEKVGIIGGGYTGVMTALLLSKLYDKYGQKLYEVHLYEKNKNLMEGTSLMLARLHLGGEYPKDPETAHECLYSSMIFRQMFQNPEAYTTIPGVAYLLSRRTSSDQLTLEQMKKNYQDIQKIYKDFYYKKFKKHYGELTDSLFFGSPQDLFQEVTTSDQPIIYLDETGTAYTQISNPSENGFQTQLVPNLSVQGFQGGIYTHEKGFQPVYLGTILEYLLEEEGVHLHCNVQQASLVQQRSNFTEAGIKKPVKYYISGLGVFDHIINATWADFKIFEDTCLERSVLMQQCREEQQVYHRAILLADISRCTIPQIGTEQTALFGQLDEGGGMASPFNNKLALFYWPSVEGSWVGTTILDNFFSFVLKNSIPDPYKELDNEHRKRNIIKSLGEKYPAYKDARPIKLIVRETLNSSEILTERRHTKAVRPFAYMRGGDHLLHMKRDYTRALSSKATYTPVTALQAVYTVLKGSGERGYTRKINPDLYKWLEDFYIKGVTLGTAILPETFRHKINLSTGELQKRAIQYCKVRQLPLEMCE